MVRSWTELARKLEEAYANGEEHGVHREITRYCSELLAKMTLKDHAYRVADQIASLNQLVIQGSASWQKLHADLLAA